MATIATHNKGIRPASIQKQDRLFVCVQGDHQLRGKATAKYAAIAGTQFLAHVDDLHWRQLGVLDLLTRSCHTVSHHPSRHLQQHQLASFGSQIRFQTRRRRSENEYTAG